MTVLFSLPAGCTLRPARPNDRVAIRNLLNQFRQEVLPQPSRTEWTLQVLTGGLLGGVGIHLGLSLGFKQLFNMLFAPGLAIGLGITIATLVTWNENWENFWVIECDKTLLACAKLRSYKQYSLLHDVYVVPEWRSQGLGSYLVAHLGTQAQKPLYLTCLPSLKQFYIRLGFMPISSKSLSPLIQYDLGIHGRFEVVPLVLK